MSEGQVLWLCILLGMFGLAVVGGIVWFGHAIFRLRIAGRFFDHPFLEEIFHGWMKGAPPYDDLPRHLAESYCEYLQRRNEFWNTYGQVLLAILIVTVLAILLLAKAISAEAGLPILSGVSGFAIAKGVSGAKTISVPQDRMRG
jgi:hypothetical protein